MLPPAGILVALKSLERDGIVGVERRAGVNSLYVVNLVRIAELSRNQCTTCTGAADTPVQEMHGGGAARCTGGGAAGARGWCSRCTQTPIDMKNTNTPSREPVGFDVFWSVYPKKVGKPGALRAYKKLKPNGSLVQLMVEAIERQAQSQGWTKDGGRFIPNPATWLNDERWKTPPRSPW